MLFLKVQKPCFQLIINAIPKHLSWYSIILDEPILIPANSLHSFFSLISWANWWLTILTHKSNSRDKGQRKKTYSHRIVDHLLLHIHSSASSTSSWISCRGFVLYPYFWVPLGKMQICKKVEKEYPIGWHAKTLNILLNFCLFPTRSAYVPTNNEITLSIMLKKDN